MQRLLALAFVAVVAAGSARADSAVRFGMDRAGLVRIDARTLTPRPGHAVPLDAHTFGWSFSPDRAQLVLGMDGFAELRFVDLQKMRVLGDVEIARPGSVFATAWAGPSRVLAVVIYPGCCGAGDTTVVGVDTARRRVLWRRALGGSLQGGERFRRSLVLVLGPRGRALGPSRLVVVGPDGRVRSARLAETRSGHQGFFPGVSQEWNPGLALDPAGRAFVVQAGAPVAEVDLRTLRVRYHTLSERISAVAAKATEGPRREALWLGHGLLAVTGTDSHADARAMWETPAGLKLIDTRDWSARTIDPRTNRAVLAGGTLFATSFLWDSRAQRISGGGLTGYALDGTRRFHLFGDDPISGVLPLGDRVLVGGAAGSRVFRRGALLDARTGRELRRVPFTLTLLAGDSPFWY